jgi:hypothetical protein
MSKASRENCFDLCLAVFHFPHLWLVVGDLCFFFDSAKIEENVFGHTLKQLFYNKKVFKKKIYINKIYVYFYCASNNVKIKLYLLVEFWVILDFYVIFFTF